ncbi:MAG: ADP-ribosylglycohydrolase family protein [Candidatus Atribacteria bacterium]|nr:MAG: ADP-ribosylglycohydrolase family protein [Candidatus Atribacteria bacterium]
MIGALVGDIVGSVYEWNNIKTKEFPLFSPDCFFTDDTVMTLAIAEGLLNGGSEAAFISAMKEMGRRYPNAGYGSRFGSWLFSDEESPYNSWGNGSAMRVSTVAWMFDTLEEVERYAEISASVTHNHPEGIKGAQATAASIFLARKGKTKQEIKAYVENTYGYDLNRALDEIRRNYTFNESCQETVPEAIIAFLESVDFEDAIRNAISLGGDSDTLAAITGSIAGAAYEILVEISNHALSLLDENLLDVYKRFQERCL